MQVIECVPNFSEGQNLPIINEIARAISSVDGAYLLHKDIGHSVNRTVMTFAGEAEAVVQAAFNAIDCASRLIDMRDHRGEHPRIGATDVCPIIPLSGISMTDCVALSEKLAQRVGRELKIPVYLYGESARLAERKNLAYLRKGGYEGLAERMAKHEFKPDFGPDKFNTRSGATVIGARKILLAYNIHLESADLNIAKSMAKTIREFRIKEPPEGFLDSAFWQKCQAIAWYVDEYKRTQISLNLLDYKNTPVHDVFRLVKELARQKGINAEGSEIIGLVPLSVLLDAGNYGLAQHNSTTKPTDRHVLDNAAIIDAAIKFLSLDRHQPFIAAEKVLEYRLAQYGLIKNDFLI